MDGQLVNKSGRTKGPEPPCAIPPVDLLEISDMPRGGGTAAMTYCW